MRLAGDGSASVNRHGQKDLKKLKKEKRDEQIKIIEGH